MILAEGHELSLVSEPCTYMAIDWSHPAHERKEITTYTRKVACSCGWSEAVVTRYGSDIDENDFHFEHERVKKCVDRHRRVANGQKGIYECGCTRGEGRRRTKCATHGKPYIPLKPSNYKKASMSAMEVLDHLAFSYQPDEWAFFTELRLATGWNYGKNDGINGDQRMDAFAFNTWPSKKHRRIAFEVKVSRSDFLSEIKNPSKRESAMRVANEFYFVAPLGLIKKEEVPEDCGLIEIQPTGGRKFTVKAPFREVDDPPLRFISSLLRAASRKTS